MGQSELLSDSRRRSRCVGSDRGQTCAALAEGAGQLHDGGDGDEAVRRVRGDVVTSGRGRAQPERAAGRGTLDHRRDQGVQYCTKGPVSFGMAARAAAKPSGGARGDVVAGRRGLGGRNGAMEAPPERHRDQGVQRCAKGPVSVVMAVMAKPPGGSGSGVVKGRARACCQAESPCCSKGLMRLQPAGRGKRGCRSRA